MTASVAGSPERTAIAMTVNGRTVHCDIEPRRSLIDVLRRDLGLTGTLVGCETGACGSCTVLADGAAVRSCLMLAVEAAGSELLTVEGLSTGPGLTPLQTAFADHHALQCGACTPGMLMLATQLLADEPDASEHRIREAVSANLCRCTGYATIIQAIVAAQGQLDG